MNRIRVTAAVQYTTEIEIAFQGGPAHGAERFVPLENGNVPPELITGMPVRTIFGTVMVESVYRFYQGCYHWVTDIIIG